MAANPKSKSRNQKSVVLGVTGSIAAYKSAEVASLLLKQHHNVFVVMTADAMEFITPLTLQTLSKNPVTTSFFEEKENWRPGHIELADNADLLLIAPATANVIAELAHGLAGHPLSAIALATRATILVAPAMNGKMWDIAAAALELNHDVILISGPVNLAPPAGAKLVNVITSDEMHAAVHEAVRDCDVLVMSAAVSDYKPAGVAKTKIKKRDENFCLDL